MIVFGSPFTPRLVFFDGGIGLDKGGWFSCTVCVHEFLQALNFLLQALSLLPQGVDFLPQTGAFCLQSRCLGHETLNQLLFFLPGLLHFTPQTGILGPQPCYFLGRTIKELLGRQRAFLGNHRTSLSVSHKSEQLPRVQRAPSRPRRTDLAAYHASPG